jgi:hypothetical protein
MTNALNYAVKAFDWQGTVYEGTFSFRLTRVDTAPHFDRTGGMALSESTPVTFDAFTIAGILTIADLGLRDVALEGLEYVSPIGPPLCMIFIAPGVSGVTLSLFPGDSAFQSVEGPLVVGGQTYTVMGR